MSAQLLELGISASLTALDEAVDKTAGTTGWGTGVLNQKWSLILELAGVAVGVWGHKVGLGAAFTTPVAATSLDRLGRRGAQYSTS